MKRDYLLLLLFILPFLTKAQINSQRIDSLLMDLETNQLAMGNIAITQHGQLVYQRHFGKDQISTTRYRIGSITKVFTATLVYQLIDAGRLALTDPLSKFFPELPNADLITVAHLLGHRSGLTNFTEKTDFDGWKMQPKTRQELLAFIKNRKPEFQPGAMASYNNSNYLLLGFILEKIYGKDFRAIVTDKIIRPLDLKYTYYGTRSGFTADEAVSYKYFNGNWQPEPPIQLDNFGGAGAIIAAPSDLCAFITALFNGKLISPKSLDYMKQMRDGYGNGLFPFGDAAHRGLGHNGKTEGFASSVQYYPENGLAIAYCTNGEVYNKDKILEHVFKACFRIADTLPSFEPVALTAAQLQNFTGNFHADFGLEVNTRLDGGKLFLALKGQDFELIPIGPTAFRNKPFGFFFNFEDGGKKLLIHDVESTYSLNKR